MTEEEVYYVQIAEGKLVPMKDLFTEEDKQYDYRCFARTKDGQCSKPGVYWVGRTARCAEH